jgi:hypothetical protein
MYSGFTLDRDNLLASIRQSLSFVEEKEIAELMSAVIRKVNAMTAEDFAKIDLSNVLDTVSPE